MIIIICPLASCEVTSGYTNKNVIETTKKFFTFDISVVWLFP